LLEPSPISKLTAPSLAVPQAPHASVPPSAVFLPLFAPFGISSGYVSVTLAFLLARAGLSTLEITTIIAGTIWVQTWSAIPSFGTGWARREPARRSWP
jgi:hypothetical protein